MANERLSGEILDDYLLDAFTELRPHVKLHHPECIEEMEQAYDQLREMIKNSCKMSILEQLSERGVDITALQQKPTVSKKKVYQFVDKEFQDRGFENSPYRPMSCEVKDMILSILKELGIKMEEK